MNEITKYTKEDFVDGTGPFEAVYQHMDNPFELNRAIEKMSEAAKAAGVSNFKTLFKAYCVWQKRINTPEGSVDNACNFEGQELDLNTGEWVCDEGGVTRENMVYPYGEVVACVHPIMPVQRLVNIDTQIEKLKLAYKKGRDWRHIICDKKQLASANSIVALADYGVAVTSESAKHLVKYLHDVEHLNYNQIPENSSVSRLGWIDGSWFSPYVDELIFDGDLSFKHFFDSVKQKGSFEKWLDVAREVRGGSIYGRIVLAASFSSVLVEPCGCLPFFVHLWGGTETGKTVALMLAASVWANPEMGKYIHTFNSTAVAQELSAGFVNSLPLILDELQIQKDKKDFDQLIYQLSEGVGRSRGAKVGGLQRTSTWNNCILTTGEQPISTGHSGAGVVNRIVELNCEDMKIFKDPVWIADTIKRNYGYAGRMFVERLQDPKIMEEARDMQRSFYREFSQRDTTEKQAMSASLILTADILTTAYIFEDGMNLEFEDIEPFLSSKEDVSLNRRAFEWVCEWVAQYRNKFVYSGELTSEQWGKLSSGKVCIIRNVFDKACIDNGFNPKSFLSWLRQNDMIETSGKGYTKSTRILGTLCNCVVLRLDSSENDDEI